MAVSGKSRADRQCAGEEPGSSAALLAPFAAGLFVPIVGAPLIVAVVQALLAPALGADVNSDAALIPLFGLMLLLWGALAHLVHAISRGGGPGRGRAAAAGIYCGQAGWVLGLAAVGYWIGVRTGSGEEDWDFILVSTESVVRGAGVAAQVLVALLIVLAVDWRQHRRDAYFPRLLVTAVPFAIVCGATWSAVTISLAADQTVANLEQHLGMIMAGLLAGLAGAAGLLALPPMQQVPVSEEDDRRRSR